MPLYESGFALFGDTTQAQSPAIRHWSGFIESPVDHVLQQAVREIALELAAIRRGPRELSSPGRHQLSDGEPPFSAKLNVQRCAPPARGPPKWSGANTAPKAVPR